MHHDLKNPDGTWKYTNELASQTSPYLLQHAHNPVQWYPWGEKAFELSRSTGKPIFLSIGYSTCYWCHVMERQSFENPAIAAVMNEHFINIKVDREERPDVDDIYMTAVQLMTGSGGWPMSVFLTAPGGAGSQGKDDPGLKPFYAGTYFPPEDAYGRPGFPTLLKALSDAWRNKRADVLEQADRIADAVKDHLSRIDEAGELTADSISRSASSLLRSCDAEYGGFGSAPKFPQPVNVAFLLAVYRNNQDAEIWNAIAHTLRAMAEGGIYDQVGGGFHRYSTDEKWLVPHFEKMLYDNGQLAELYVVAHEIKPDADEPDFYLRIAREVCDYVLREMTDATGAFWSAQDAEVDAREGANYLWLPDEINAAVNDSALAQLALRMYGLDKGTNFQDPHHRDEAPKNVLYLPVRLHKLAVARGVSLAQVLDSKRQIDAMLLAVRDKRKQPGTDDKVLTSWNGMMIAGMARVGKASGDDRYIAAAARAASYIHEHMADHAGGLYRSMRKGEVKIPAFLEDYAFFIHGLIELHRADGDTRWIEAAEKLTTTAVDRFGSTEHGGYFDTLADQADLFVRTRSMHDGALPSGNSQMVHNLIDLHQLTGKGEYLDRASRDLKAASRILINQPMAVLHMQHALLRALESVSTDATTPSSASADRQRRQVVDIAVTPEQINLSAGEAEVTITLAIGPEYHLNAHEPGQDGLIATTLLLDRSPGYELDTAYPKGQTRKFPFADGAIAVYEGKVTLKARLRRLPDAAADSVPRLLLRYQVCTDSSCLEPREVELPLRLVPQQ